MAANMENKMFATKSEKQPWWAKEEENYSFPNATNRELFSASKADFNVSLHPVYDRNGATIQDYSHLVNDNNGATLRVCKGRFVPNQSEAIFSILDQLGEMESCGAIGNGEKVFFNMAGDMYNVGEGNTMQTHIVSALPHDGTMKLTLGLSTVRVECANTFTQWKKSLNADEVFSTKQTARAGDRLGLWVNAFNEMREANQTLQDKFKTLAKMKFSAESQAAIISALYGEKESTRSKNNMAKLAQIIGDNASKIPPGQRGTGWDLFNGVTYLTTHENSLKKNTDRLESSLFGTSQKFAEKAFDLILGSTPDSMVQETGNRVLSLN